MDGKGKVVLRNLEFLDSKEIGQKYRGLRWVGLRGLYTPENEGMSLWEGSIFKGQNHLATINFQGICYCLGRAIIPLRLAICCRHLWHWDGFRAALLSYDCWHHFYAGSFPSHPLNPWEPHNLQPSGVVAYSLSPISLGLKTLIVGWFWVPKVVGGWTSHLKTVALGWWYS